MNNSIYRILREKAEETREKLGTPSFYRALRKELAVSGSSFLQNPAIRRCRPYLQRAKLHPAHGIFHCEKVAVEAGAIVQAERGNCAADGPETAELMLCAQIAGLLHDITRCRRNHTVTGSIEAALILRDFDMSDVHKRYITAAIRNHEAFKKARSSVDEEGMLVSNALYDADKFRWGPDNFTVTLWLITESSGISPATLHGIFRENMEFIGSIRDTFRTATGKKYGPEFIDMGITIGKEIYRELSNILGD